MLAWFLLSRFTTGVNAHRFTTKEITMNRLMSLLAILLFTGMLTLAACEPVDEDEFEEMEQDMEEQDDFGGDDDDW